MPPLQPDVIGCGKPSDHSVPFARRYVDRSRPKNKNYSVKTVQPFPDSGVSEFGRWIQREDFSCLDSAADTTGKVAAFGNLIAEKVEEIFPTKEIKVYDGDKEFMTPQLRKLRRQKSREYGRKKRSEKFLKLQKEFLEIKVANSKEYIKEIEDLKNCNLGQFFHKIKQIGSRQGECSKNTFSLSSHVEGNLDAEAAAEQIALHFSSISKEYPPIDPEKLPDRVKEKIFNVNVASEAPVIEDYQVYEMFKKRKMKNSSVPGDVPTKLKKEFLPEFSGPAATIFNSITKSGFILGNG